MIIPELLWPIVLALVAVIQIFFYIHFFSKLAFHKTSAKVSSQEYPVSVIVCARDEAENLARNLPGILVQDYKTSHEIIVVNDNSTDESKYLLEEFQKTFKNLNIVPLTQEALMIPGKKFPLSVGIKSAKYETLLLTDADCMPASENWIKKMQDGFRPGIDIVLGYGAYKKYPGILNKLIRFETFHSALQYLSFALAGIPYMGVGRNLSYKKELFFRNKGFSSINHIPSGDDDLFINKVATETNTTIVIDIDAHTLSEPETTWSSWMRQKGRHYTTARYYKPKHKLLLGIYSAMQSLLIPMVILTALLFNWQFALGIYLFRLIVIGVIWKKAMAQLNENDLWPYFIFFDIWLFIYNLLFVPALWKKPKKTWN